MGYDLRNAALIACCVLAIVVAASLFPAAGYGDYPDRDAVDSEYYGDGSSSDGVLPFAVPNVDPGDLEGETDPEESEEESDDVDETDDDADDADEADDDADEAAGSDVSLSSNALAVLLIGSLVGTVALSWRLTDPTRSEAYDASDLPTGFLPNVTLRLHRIPQLTMAATIGVSRLLPALADAAASVSGDVAAGLGAVARDVGRGVGSVLLAAPATLALSVRSVGSPFSITGGISSLLSGVRRRERGHSARSSAPERVVDDGPSIEEPEFGPKSVEEAWEEMVEAVTVRRDPTATPAEYAGKAVEAGLPPDPVAALTDAFREIRYGGYPPSPERTRRAREAAARIRTHRRENGGEPE